MSKRGTQFFVFVTVAGGLAILPSIGSRGMGTIENRFAHADLVLFEPSPPAETTQFLLERADYVVDRQIERLVEG